LPLQFKTRQHTQRKYKFFFAKPLPAAFFAAFAAALLAFLAAAFLAALAAAAEGRRQKQKPLSRQTFSETEPAAAFFATPFAAAATGERERESLAVRFSENGLSTFDRRYEQDNG
jgi:ABC-type Na+ efflux pump permease subunit